MSAPGAGPTAAARRRASVVFPDPDGPPTATSQGEVLSCSAAQRGRLRSAAVQGQGGRLGHRADGRPHREEERQQRQAADVTRALDVAVEHRVGVPRQIPVQQVHEQERQVVHPVHAGDGLVELDAVEQHRPPAEQADVAQMEVAVAAPHETGGPPGIEQAPVAGQGAEACCPQRLGGRVLEHTPPVRAHPVPDPAQHGGHAAPTALIETRFGDSVQVCDGIRQPWHQDLVERTTRRQPVELGVGVEALHLHDVVDGAAPPVQSQQAARRPTDGPYATVQLRGSPAVQAHFLETAMAAPLRRRIVQVVEPHGPLELEGPVAREKHHRGVRVDTLHGSGSRAVGAGRRQPRDHVRLIDRCYGRRTGERLIGWHRG